MTIMYKPNVLDGKRLRLIKIEDQYTDLKPGDEGSVDYVDDMGQIHMKWDNGGTLALIPEIDKYEIIEESFKGRFRKPKYHGKLMMFESFNLNNALDTLNDGVALIRKMVNSSGVIQMKYETDKEYYTATLEIYLEDGNNTQGVIYEVDLEQNMVVKSTYVRSDNVGDNDDDESNESHYQTVGEIVEFLTKEVSDYIKIEERKKHEKGKRV